MSEQLFIRNTAPTLAGIKTGSLFPYHYQSRTEALRELRTLNQRLTPKGLRLLPLRMTDRYAMLYLYRPGLLQKDLNAREAARLLREVGYADTNEINCITELMQRLKQGSEFPHEIGLFLSYPPEDVRGFMEHRDRDCKCVGCWKVYGDAASAKRKFRQYERCTDSYLRLHSKGCPLENLTIQM